MLRSPPRDMIGRQPIAARKTETACGNSMHFFIELSFEGQASLNNLAWRLNIEVLYCLPRGLRCVITGTVRALGSVDDRELLSRIDSAFDSHQSTVARKAC